MKRAYRIVINSKKADGTWGNPHPIYTTAEDEHKAMEYFNNNFSRFNVMLSVTDISNTVKGKELLARR